VVRGDPTSKREITAAITEAMVKIGKTTADQVQIVFRT
jgi:phenylpyruvate tautomerase PptA (4-oxalocrotonate tautomerase family)